METYTIVGYYADTEEPWVEYGKGHNTMIVVLGQKSDRFTDGFGVKGVSSAKRAKLVKRLSKEVGIPIGKVAGIVGELS